MFHANIGIFFASRILNGFRRNFRAVITATNRWTGYILGEVVAMWQGRRIRQRIRIDVKPVLPCSVWLHKFHSMYGTLHLQGWRVHYTHAAAEASYDRVRSLALVSCAFDTLITITDLRPDVWSDTSFSRRFTINFKVTYLSVKCLMEILCTPREIIFAALFYDDNSRRQRE